MCAKCEVSARTMITSDHPLNVLTSEEAQKVMNDPDVTTLPERLDIALNLVGNFLYSNFHFGPAVTMLRLARWAFENPEKAESILKESQALTKIEVDN